MRLTVDMYDALAGDTAKLDALNAQAARRMNFGSGQHPLYFWTNVDSDLEALAELRVSVPPIPREDNSLDEIYAGHFFEHLTPAEGKEFLREAFRVLKPGGKIGLVVPDTY